MTILVALNSGRNIVPEPSVVRAIIVELSFAAAIWKVFAAEFMI